MRCVGVFDFVGVDQDWAVIGRDQEGLFVVHAFLAERLADFVSARAELGHPGAQPLIALVLLCASGAFRLFEQCQALHGEPVAEEVVHLAAQIFGPIADAHIVVDMIIQNASEDGTTDLTFTVPKADHQRALSIVEKSLPEVHAKGVRVDTDIAKVSVVGVGMRTHAGVAATMFHTLAREKINIQMISTSEIKISVVVGAKQSDQAVRALHQAFITN